MNIIYIASFVALCAGTFLLFGIDPVIVVDEIKATILKLRPHRKLTMKQQIEHSFARKEPKGIRKILIEARTVLEMTHRTDRLPTYTVVSVVLFIIGLIVGPLISNFFSHAGTGRWNVPCSMALYHCFGKQV